MIKKFVSIILLFLVTQGVMAQSGSPESKTGKRPDIPGTFLLELGINRMTERPGNLKYGLWGSRTLNIYYQYDMRIANSRFTFHPGIGLGLERFKLQRYSKFSTDTITYTNPTPVFDIDGNTSFVDAAHFIYDADTLGQINYSGSYSTKKSMLVMNYVDIPVEFRYNVNPEDPARSFKIAIGGRVGYLISSYAKLKYKEDGDPKKLKNYQNFNLSPLRYSLYMKIFIGNFGLFGYYNLNPLFKDEKGPMKTQAQTYTVGITLASF